MQCNCKKPIKLNIKKRNTFIYGKIIKKTKRLKHLRCWLQSMGGERGTYQEGFKDTDWQGFILGAGYWIHECSFYDLNIFTYIDSFICMKHQENF